MASYDLKRQSILGALFSTFKGSSPDIDDTPDDLHTRSLLFPDGRQEVTATLQSPRDVRILVAQDASGAHSKSVLYDSTTDRTRRRGLHGVFQSEPVGEMRLLLDCMFGTTPLSYRGDTTKLHILPNDEWRVNSPIARDPSGSWGRRRSQLSHSFTPNDVVESSETVKETRAVLLTRTFSVNLPDLPEYVSEKPRQRKTPMYAVAMIVQISRGDPFGVKDVDDRIDVVMRRFDVVARVLSSLQAVVRPIILGLLERTADSLRYEGNVKPRKQMFVQLEAGVLISDDTVKTEVERAGARLASGLRIPKVATGQCRWDQWQDEARWIERWAGGREHNFFFDRLLTAFLGNHTLWVSGLGLGRRPAHDDCIPRRTVIVGGDKPAARRLIFLLAAFLPGVVCMWSPPRMEEKTARQETTPEKASSALPIPPTGTRKSSATTTATITPADIRSQGLHTVDGSPASSMVRTMKRENSTDHSTDSQPVTRWGSLVSGFWSNRRGSSTDDSEVTIPPDEAGSRGGSKSRRSGGKLAQMVRQVDLSRQDDSLEPLPRGRHAGPRSEVVSPEPIIYPDSPLKLSVDEKDGVVDVDFQMPSFLSSSFGSSAARSPSVSGFTTGSFDEGSFIHSGLPPIVADGDGDSPVNVAGWLRRFHPDFILQAVQSYPELIDEMKTAMTMEPVSTGINRTRWKTVCTTLIADAGTFTVKRLRLLRRVVHLDPPDPPSSETPLQQSTEEHKFIEEPVFDMDGTLIDAVERVVCGPKPIKPAETTRPSVMALTAALGDGSGRASRASSISRPAGSIKTVHTGPDDRGEATTTVQDHEPDEMCERIIRHALEQVVKDVLSETKEPSSSSSSSDEQDMESEDADEQDRRGKMTGVTVNSLRDGIRRWLKHGES